MAVRIVRAHVDEKTTEEASAVLEMIGMTVSDAFRMMIMRIAKEKRLPFEPFSPNAETLDAMKAARIGDLIEVGTIENLFVSLHADD